MRVNEGVTVTAQESDGANAGPWYADGALVLNRGTILADFQTAGESGRICCVLNYGTIAGAFHMDCPGNLLNFGELHISQAQFLQTNLWNLGDLALEAEGEESRQRRGGRRYVGKPHPSAVWRFSGLFPGRQSF